MTTAIITNDAAAQKSPDTTPTLSQERSNTTRTLPQNGSNPNIKRLERCKIITYAFGALFIVSLLILCLFGEQFGLHRQNN